MNCHKLLLLFALVFLGYYIVQFRRDPEYFTGDTAPEIYSVAKDFVVDSQLILLIFTSFVAMDSFLDAVISRLFVLVRLS